MPQPLTISEIQANAALTQLPAMLGEMNKDLKRIARALEYFVEDDLRVNNEIEELKKEKEDANQG